jgi:Tol biopolymer transport system component
LIDAVVDVVVNCGIIGHAWSPDGSSLAYVANDEIHSVSFADGKTNLLAKAFEPHSLSWSPDGRWIALVSGNPNYVFAIGLMGNMALSSIAVIPSEGGAPRFVTDNTTANVSPVWPADSKSILFVFLHNQRA